MFVHISGCLRRMKLSWTWSVEYVQKSCNALPLIYAQALPNYTLATVKQALTAKASDLLGCDAEISGPSIAAAASAFWKPFSLCSPAGAETSKACILRILKIHTQSPSN